MDDFEGLAFLTHTYHVTWAKLIGRDVDHSAVDGDVAVADDLTSRATGGREAKTENCVVKARFEETEQVFTCGATLTCSDFEGATELLFKHTVGELGFLLFSELNAVFRALLHALGWAVLAWAVRLTAKVLIMTKDCLAKATGNFGTGTGITCH